MVVDEPLGHFFALHYPLGTAKVPLDGAESGVGVLKGDAALEAEVERFLPRERIVLPPPLFQVLHDDRPDREFVRRLR